MLTSRDLSPTTAPPYRLPTMLDLSTNPPRRIGMPPGTQPSGVSTVKFPPVGGLRPPHHHLPPAQPASSTSGTRLEYSKTSSTLPGSSETPLHEGLRLFPFIPEPPQLTPPTNPSLLLPWSSSPFPLLSPLPPLTPSTSPSPAPPPLALPPTLAPHPPAPFQSLRATTVWGDYLATQGGRVGPKRMVKIPQRYRLLPEERRDEDEWMLTQIPTQGKRLTRSRSTKFLRRGHPPLKATRSI
jgi:hypothetical protein